MFVIKDNIIESIKLPGLLGSDMNHNYTLQPWEEITDSGVIVLPEILNNENQFLVNNNALNDVITTTSSTTAYFITNDDNTIVGKILSSSATILLLSSSNNNSFTLSTKVKRQHASMSGITSSSNNQLGYCTGLHIFSFKIYTNIVLLKFTTSIKSLIQENSNVPMLVNVSFLANTINNVSTDSCIAGFFSYAGDDKTREFYNGHQSSMQYAVNANVNYIDYNETYVTWESIDPIVDMYGIRSLSNIIDSDISPSDILNPFTGNIYYRFEIIVYTG